MLPGARRHSSPLMRGTRASGLECGGPPPLSARLRFLGTVVAAVLALTLSASAQTAANRDFTAKVVDSKGQPVSGATVEVYESRSAQLLNGPDMDMKQRATTDSSGSFKVVPPITGTIIVTKPGFAAAWRTQMASQGVMDASPFVLASPSSLAGIVVDEHGQPMANADVSVELAIMQPQRARAGVATYAFGSALESAFHARTGSDGRFRIPDFPPEAGAKLSVRAPGKALHRDANSSGGGLNPNFRAGRDDIKLVVEPAGSIEGKVTVQATGEPVGQVTIEASFADQSVGFPPKPVQSSADGSFRIVDAAAGSYTMSAVFPGKPLPDWTAATVPVSVVAGETARNVKIQAVKGGVLEVTVRSKPDGKPVAANVSIYSGGQPLSAIADADGVARFRAAPGQVTVMAATTGGGQVQQQAQIVANQTSSVRLDVPSPHKVSGVVTDASGKPVAGAVMTVIPTAGGMDSGSTSDASGHYEVSWQEPPWAANQAMTYSLVARDVDRNLATAHEITGKTSSLDLTLEPGLTISTRVQEKGGSPIANASVSVQFFSGNSSSTLQGNPAMSDSDGRVSIAALPPGGQYGLWINASGYGNGNVQNLIAKRGQPHLDVPPVSLRTANRKLAGRVLGTNGKPMANANVFINGDGQPNGNATTDEKGNFVFDAVCDGPIDVQANAQGNFGNQQTVGGDTNVVIRMGSYAQAGMPTSTVSGRVYDPKGNPARDIQVVVTPSFGPFNDTTTDDNGDYTINWQPQQGMQNARYLVIARDLDHDLAAAEPVNEKTTNVDLHLDRALSISGVVQDASGAPLPQANVNLNIMVGNMGGMVGSRQVTPDANGSFTIHALPRDRQYGVYVSATGYGSRNRQLRQTQTQTNKVELPIFRLPTADRTIAGKIVGDDKKPIIGAQVNINGDGQPNGFIRTDEDGHFSFQVCPGQVMLFAYSQPRSGNGQFLQGNMQVMGGDTNIVMQIGAYQQQRGRNNGGNVVRSSPLLPQPWTWMAILNWPDQHRTATIFLMGGQVLALAGTATGIFAVVRRRKQ